MNTFCLFVPDEVIYAAATSSRWTASEKKKPHHKEEERDHDQQRDQVDDDDDSEKHDHQEECYEREVCQYAHTLVEAPARYKLSCPPLSVFEALSFGHH